MPAVATVGTVEARRALTDAVDAMNRGPVGDGTVKAFLDALDASFGPEMPGRAARMVVIRRGPLAGTVVPVTDFGRLPLGRSGRVLVFGRTLLPGHPIHDERRFEVGVLDYRRPEIPSWFPGDRSLDRVFTARVEWATDGLATPDVFGVFSELFEGRPAWSGDGGAAFLLASRVVRLFAQRTGAALEMLEIEAPKVGERDRAAALLAHEWGHDASGYGPAPGTTHGDDPAWTAAIQHEWDADAAALEMLSTATGDEARRAFDALVLDKLLRLAWYPERNDRPDAAASRRFVAWCLGRGVIRADGVRRVAIAWDGLWCRIRAGGIREIVPETMDAGVAGVFRDAYRRGRSEHSAPPARFSRRSATG